MFVPRTIQEAQDHMDWKLAILKEINAIRKNGTLEVVDLSKEKKTMGCKWMFMIKCKAGSIILR